MNSVVTLAGALGLGAGLAYFLDPDRGRGRRRRASDQLASATSTARDTAGAASRDLRNRVVGTVAAVRSRLTPDDADDDVIVERVRARMGSAVRHPRALDVFAADGRVTLRGHVLAREVGPLIRRVSAVRGVRSIDNQLEVHRRPDVPDLQGAGGRARQRRGSSTAGRLVAGLIGAALGLWGIRQPGIVHTTVGLIGVLLVAASVMSEQPPLQAIRGVPRAA
jgi:osmotically-inducible protein OsmY